MTTEAKKMKVEFTAVQTRLTDEELDTVVSCVRDSDLWTQGDQLKAFEKEWMEHCVSGDAIGVSSCSAALELAAMICQLNGGDVIIPGHTFVSSAVPFGRFGGNIVWADIDPETRLVTADTIEAKLTDKTKAVVVVHLYGLMADMDPIMDLAKRRNLLVVEDCAQAPGATYKGRRAGSIGDFGCFSFHTQKNISTMGEGGMLTVRSKEHAEAARKLRWMGNWPFEGKRDRYWLPAMGDIQCGLEGVWPGNYCVSEAQCAVGRMLLKRLDDVNTQRLEQADKVRAALSEYPELSFQKVSPDHGHVYHLLAARYDGDQYGKTRDDLIEHLNQNYDVKSIVQYWPLYRSSLFQSFGFGEADCPECDRFFDNMVSFPWWSYMESDLLDYMVDSIRSSLEALRAG
jgi:dTDP-4-amino-4,6-dideoxygalactose transaminase